MTWTSLAEAVEPVIEKAAKTMTSNTRLKHYATELSEIYRDIADKQVMAKALTDAAHEEGINIKALKKAAKELTMDAEKRRAKYADEADLEDMRIQLSLFSDDVHDRRAA